MGKLIKRQNLSERQYLRANRVMCMILLISYLVYTVVEVINAKEALGGAALTRSEQRRQVEAVNMSFQDIQKGMEALQKSIETMGRNVKLVLSSNGEIVDSIALLSAASEEVSAGTQVCKQTTGMAFENLGKFSRKVDGAFDQLQHLKETAGA